MQEHWNIEQYREYQQKGNKKSKYGAVKTSVDGHTFDSKKEADYYCDLKLRLQGRRHQRFLFAACIYTSTRAEIQSRFYSF